MHTRSLLPSLSGVASGRVGCLRDEGSCQLAEKESIEELYPEGERAAIYTCFFGKIT